MCDVFDADDSKVVLLVDAFNASKSMLHFTICISIPCPGLLTTLITHVVPTFKYLPAKPGKSYIREREISLTEGAS